MQYLDLSVCWGGRCDNPATDVSGLCEDCLVFALNAVETIDWPDFLERQ